MNLVEPKPTEPEEQRELPSSTILRALETAEDSKPAEPEPSELTETHHAMYRAKLAGRSVQSIADEHGCDRTTVWRKCKAVEQEALEQYSKPVFNIVAEEIQRLLDLEQQSRQLAEQTKSERMRANYLGEARRAAAARQSFLLSTGIVPKEPDRIFQIVQDMKPVSQSVEELEPTMSRAAAIDELIEKLTRARNIQ